MSRIRARDTKPELFIRSELHKRGYRFRVNSKLVEGHPDIYFTKKRVAVFVHGCYWHRHEGCRFAYVPKSNVDFWLKKFSNNIERDKMVVHILKNNGFRVLIIWECTVKNMIKDNLAKERHLQQIETFINNSDLKFLEI